MKGGVFFGMGKDWENMERGFLRMFCQPVFFGTLNIEGGSPSTLGLHKVSKKAYKQVGKEWVTKSPSKEGRKEGRKIDDRRYT